MATLLSTVERKKNNDDLHSARNRTNSYDELLSPSFGRNQTQRTQIIITQRRKDAKEKDRDEMNSLRLA
jgi:hypothetical protein